MFDAFYDVEEKMKKGNPYAKKVMESWANAEWFTNRPEVPDKVGKVVDLWTQTVIQSLNLGSDRIWDILASV